MVPLTIRMPERRLELGVELADETFRPLVGELRLASPALAERVESVAVSGDGHVLELDEDETGYLAVAARVLLESALVDDPELEELAQL